MAGLAKGTIGAGGGRWAGPVLTAAGAVRGSRIEPLGGLPPTRGAWWLYHSFSIQFTMLAPPCSRAHSAKRGLSELPMAGLVRALPREMVSQIRSAVNPNPMTTKIRRRRNLLRRDRRSRR